MLLAVHGISACMCFQVDKGVTFYIHCFYIGHIRLLLAIRGDYHARAPPISSRGTSFAVVLLKSHMLSRGTSTEHFPAKRGVHHAWALAIPRRETVLVAGKHPF